LEMFKLEERNILREMRGATNRGGHGPVIRQLLEKLDATHRIIDRLEGIIAADKKVVSKKVTTKSAAPVKAADK